MQVFVLSQLSKSSKNPVESCAKSDKTCKFLYVFGNRLMTIDKFTAIFSDINKLNPFRVANLNGCKKE